MKWNAKHSIFLPSLLHLKKGFWESSTTKRRGENAKTKQKKRGWRETFKVKHKLQTYIKKRTRKFRGFFCGECRQLKKEASDGCRSAILKRSSSGFYKCVEERKKSCYQSAPPRQSRLGEANVRSWCKCVLPFPEELLVFVDNVKTEDWQKSRLFSVTL